jgi:hypothetical protein
VLDRPNPFGSIPDRTVHVIGVVPVAARLKLYDAPTAADGSVVVVTVGAVATELTVIGNVTFALPTLLAAVN